MTAKRDGMKQSEDINEIIRREGIDSPKLRKIGRERSGERRAEGPNGEPNQGPHIPSDSRPKIVPSRGGSETDPDAPAEATPWHDRHD
jgi:hypothetical protein